MENTKKRLTAGTVIRRILVFIFAMFLGAALLVASVVGGTFAALKWVSLERLEGFGVTVPDGILTEESPVRGMSVLDMVAVFSAIPGRLSEITVNSLIAEYGVIVTEDVLAKIPAALRDVPFSEFAEDGFLTTILSRITLGDAFEYTGDILPAAARDKLSDRTLDLVINQDFGALLEGVYVGDLMDMPVELREDGLVHPVLAEGERAYIGHYLATIDLGEYFAAEDGNSVINKALNRVPMTDMLSSGTDDDSFFYEALEGMMLGEVISLEGAGIVFSPDAIVADLYLGSILGYHPVYLEDGETIDYWADGSDKPATGVYRELVGIGVDELGSIDILARIDNVYVGELMDYERVQDGVDGDGNPVWVFRKAGTNEAPEGVTAELVGLTVGELRDPDTIDEEIKSIKVGVAMGYTQGEDGTWLDGDGNPAEGILRSLLGTSVTDLPDKIDTLYLGEVMGFDLVTDADGNPVKDADGKLQFEDAGGKHPDALMSNFSDMTLKQINDEGAFSDRVQEVLVGDAMGYTYDETLGWCEKNADGDLVPVEGIFRTLAGYKVKEMNDGVKDISVAEALGYTYNEATEKWEKDGVPMTGILRLLMSSTLNGLEDDVADIYLGDVLGYYPVDLDDDGVTDHWEDEGGNAATGVYRELCGVPVDELDDTDLMTRIDGVLVGELMEYKQDGVDADGNIIWYKEGTGGTKTYPEGIAAELVDLTIGELRDEDTLDTEIKGMQVGIAMGYTLGADGIWRDATETPASNVLRPLLGTKISGLSARLDTLYFGEVMGYTLIVDASGTPILDADGKVQFEDEAHNPPTGLMANFAGMTLTEISDDSAFSDNVKEVLVGDAMGYTYDDVLGWCEKDTDGNLTPVTGIFRTLAGHKVKDMNTAVKGISVADALGYTYNEAEGRWEDGNVPVTGILRLLADSTLDDMASDVNAIYLGEIMGFDVLRNEAGELVDEHGNLIGAGGKPVFRKGEEGSYEYPKGVIAHFVDIPVSELSDTTEMTGRIDELSIGEAMSYEKRADGWYDRNGVPLSESNSLLLSIIDTKVKDVGGVMNDLTLASVLGYTEVEGTWYKGTEEVSGFMLLIGPNTKINDMDSAIEKLRTTATVREFIDAGILDISADQQAALDIVDATWEKKWDEMTLNQFVSAVLNTITNP